MILCHFLASQTYLFIKNVMSFGEEILCVIDSQESNVILNIFFVKITFTLKYHSIFFQLFIF